MNSPTALSVCICTYNRAELLGGMLESLAMNAFMPGDEVLVINNCCTDKTSEVVQQFAARLPVKEYFQPMPGLANARNKGLELFNGDAIVFFDDDVLVSPDVVEQYRNALARHKAIEFFGGRILVKWPDDSTPVWWNEQDYALINGLVVCYRLEQPEQNIDATTRLPYGANFALRRSLTQKVGQFDPTLGVRGTGLGRGEESDYFQRALELGATGQYLGAARVAHRFEPERFSIRYMLRYGAAKGRLNAKRSLPSALFGALNQLARGTLLRLRGKTGFAYQCVIMAGIYWGEMAGKSAIRG